MAKVTLYAVDASEGDCYNVTFESREAADLFNELWERYTEGTHYGEESMEEGCVNEDAKHVYTLAEVQACDSEDWNTLAERISELCNIDNCDNTFVAVEVKEVGVHSEGTLCDYLILNRQTGEKRWLRQCVSFDEQGFNEGCWEELEK